MTRDTGLNYNRFRSYVIQAQDAEVRLNRLQSETEMNYIVDQRHLHSDLEG
jgi:RNA polymerase primary sigma factor